MNSRQLDWLEEIAEQSTFAVNDDSRDGAHLRHGTIGRLSVSPGLFRAKVARPALASPVDSPAAPEAIPEAHLPVVPRVVMDRAELIAALRERKELLDLSHEAIDGLIGWADRYSSKVLSPRPRKGLSGATLQLILDALALGVAGVVLVEDPELVRRMQPRWSKRGNSGPRPNVGALFGKSLRDTLSSTTEDSNVETKPEFSSEA